MASHLLVCHHSLTMFLLAYISLLVTFSNGSVLAFEQSAPQNHISQQLPESLARDASMRFRDQFFQPYVVSCIAFDNLDSLSTFDLYLKMLEFAVKTLTLFFLIISYPMHFANRCDVCALNCRHSSCLIPELATPSALP